MLKGFLFPFAAEKRTLTTLKAYLDESADGAQKSMFTVGALLGSDEKWGWLETEWRDTLKDTGIEYFRTADCVGVDGPFLGYRKNLEIVTDSDRAKALAVRNKLLEIIIQSRLLGIGMAVDMESFQRVANTTEKREAFGNTPYYHCYFLALTRLAAIIKENLPQDFIAFGFDEHETFAKELSGVYHLFKERNPDIAPHMTTLAPFDDKVFLPIQAADVIASCTRRFATWKTKTPQKVKPREWEMLEQSHTHTMASVEVCQDDCLNAFLREKGL